MSSYKFLQSQKKLLSNENGEKTIILLFAFFTTVYLIEMYWLSILRLGKEN